MANNTDKTKKGNIIKMRQRRGNNQETNSYVGGAGELTVNTDTWVVHLHDGVNAGGHVVLMAHSATKDDVGLGNVQNYPIANKSQVLTPTSNSVYMTPLRTKELLESGNFSQIFKVGNLDPQNVTLKVENVDYGWKHIQCSFTYNLRDRDSPSTSYLRDGIMGYSFRRNRLNQLWSTVTIGSDYALGTKVYPAIQIAPESDESGTVRFGIEYSVAKSHGNGEFGASSLIYLEATYSENGDINNEYLEASLAQAIPATDLEPDSVIALRVFRDGRNNNDTFGGNVFLLSTMVKYQAARISTKNRTPDFYT